MTFTEFLNIFDPIVKMHPTQYPAEKVQAIYFGTKGFGEEWLTDKVQKLLLSSNPFFNFDELISNEHRIRGGYSRTEQLIRDQELRRSQITDNGLENALKDLGASSLLEAIEKAKVGT